MSVQGKKVGVLMPQVERGMDGATPRGSDVLALAKQAEEAGFDSVWLVDHFLWHVPAMNRYEELVPDGEAGIRQVFCRCRRSNRKHCTRVRLGNLG